MQQRSGGVEQRAMLLCFSHNIVPTLWFEAGLLSSNAVGFCLQLYRMWVDVQSNNQGII